MLRVLIGGVFCIAILGCAKPSAPSRELPDFSLTGVTIDGTSPFDRGTLRGRAWIASFVYTRCSGPCPVLTSNTVSRTSLMVFTTS